MALNSIETAPKTDDFIILQDQNTGVYEVAQWSGDRGEWVREDGDPIRIKPTHWMLLPTASSLPTSPVTFEPDKKLLTGKRVAFSAVFLFLAGAGILYGPSGLDNFARLPDRGNVNASAMPAAVAPQTADLSRDVKSAQSAPVIDPPSAQAEIEPVSGYVVHATAVVDLASIEHAQGRQAAEAAVTEQKQMFERERQRDEALARDLASAREQVQVLTARSVATDAANSENRQKLQAAEASIAEQRKATEQERKRVEVLARDLTLTREEVKTFKAAASAADNALRTAHASASELKAALEKEQQRRNAVVSDLAAARVEIEALNARVSAEGTARGQAAQTAQEAQTVAAEQKKAAEQERQRADSLARDLASAKKDIESRDAARSAAGNLAQKTQASASEQKDALDKEQQRSTAALRDLASAKAEVDALRARVSVEAAARDQAAQAAQDAQAVAAERSQALAQERQRAESLARDLASVRAEREALKTGPGTGPEAVRQDAQSVQTAATTPQPAPEAAAQSTTGSTSGVRAAPSARVAAADPKGWVEKEDTAITSVRKPVVPPSGDGTAPAAPPVRAINDQIALFVKRGEDFIAVGDFASARLVFQRAAEIGDAKAALMLGATYDPNILDRFQAKGLAPDMAKARFWYEKARDLGSVEASRRLELLTQVRR